MIRRLPLKQYAGKIVEEGTYEVLMAANVFFADLVKRKREE